ncbi:MAG: IS3 family transposase [Candidatus Latescibacteria bacterium]|nr:IS3 family transposase [Candidatus Latescibacterota bacterium]
MHTIDEHYTQTPFYGIRRMTAWLRSEGYQINPKRVQRLLRAMGLEALYPGPRCSQKGNTATTYPCLLKGLLIERSDQVWCGDITSIRLRQGFVYLIAIMDWLSRYVLGKSLTPLECS